MMKDSKTHTTLNPDIKATENGRSKRKPPSPCAASAAIVIMLGIVVFLSAGTVSWWQGWVFWMIYTLFMLVAYANLKKNPQLLARRMGVNHDVIAKKPPAFLNLFFLCFIIPGLDYRFGWSVVPLWLIVVSDIAIILGCALILRVFHENTYASASIQIEQGQHVIMTGPYRIVRHPMYLGIVLMVAFAPLALGSWWGLVPALLVIPMNVIRLTGEEKLLRGSLAGYEDYCKATRFRLFPGIW